MVKGLDTILGEYVFRSRLEARWAIFFNTLAIEYRYEPKIFHFEHMGAYLPDFWLPKTNGGSWIEIKGELPTEPETLKAIRLHQQTNAATALFSGMFNVQVFSGHAEMCDFGAYIVHEGELVQISKYMSYLEFLPSFFSRHYEEIVYAAGKARSYPVHSCNLRDSVYFDLFRMTGIRKVSELKKTLESHRVQDQIGGVMNLDQNPTIEDFTRLIASHDDEAASHILWVDKLGEVHLTPLPEFLSPAAWVADNEGKIQFRFETYLRGNSYVGQEAAKDQEYVSSLFNALMDSWSKGATGYIDH